MMKYVTLLSVWLALLLPTGLAAQNWVYEQIEGPGNWLGVEIEVMPSGAISVYYQDTATGEAFLSRRDSGWCRDSLGEWAIFGGRHLTIGPGLQAAVLLEQDTILCYVVRMDSGLRFTSEPWHGSYPEAFLAFDSSGNPCVVLSYTYFSAQATEIVSWYRQNGTWTTDQLAWGSYLLRSWLMSPTELRLGPANRFCLDWGHYGGYPPRYYDYVATAVGRTGQWNQALYPSWGGACISVAPTRESLPAVCYLRGFGFYCDDESIDVRAERGRIRVDGLGHRQIVYRCGVLKHAYRTGTWHIDTLPPEINSAPAFDFAIDGQDRPLIAFTTESGIFLASRDAVGVEENGTSVTGTPSVLPTIVRGVLDIPRKPGTAPVFEAKAGTVPVLSLLNAMGRAVLDLHPGPNDVSRLAPGVYFVRWEAQAEAQAVRKVVIAE